MAVLKAIHVICSERANFYSEEKCWEKNILDHNGLPIALTEVSIQLNPLALNTVKNPWSFGCSECNRVKKLAKNKQIHYIYLLKIISLKCLLIS